MTLPRHVIVVGAGIVGAAIASRLARSGFRVTVAASQPGGVATAASFAWINASWGNPQPYFRLRSAAMQEWARLRQDVPGLAPASRGALIWDLPLPEQALFEKEHRGWGYDIRRVSRDDIATIEPGLAEPPESALYAESESAVDPVPAALALLEDARRHGASLLDVEVLRLTADDRGMTGVETAAGTIAADHVVLAAGAATPQLASTIGVTVPLETPPGLLVHSKPAARLLSGLAMAPDLHMRQTAEGRIVAGSSFGGSDPGRDAEKIAAALFARVRRALKGTDALELDFHTLGFRPTPADGFPLAGPVEALPGLTLAVMHSGVTLAPAIARFLVAEIAGGAPEPLLAPYRPARLGFLKRNGPWRGYRHGPFADAVFPENQRSTKPAIVRMTKRMTPPKKPAAVKKPAAIAISSTTRIMLPYFAPLMKRL